MEQRLPLLTGGARNLPERPVDIADSISRFASTLAHFGTAETAVRVLSCSEALREELGVRRSWVLERNEETLAIVRSRLTEAEFAEAWEEGHRLSPDEAATLARTALRHGYAA